MVIDSTIFIEHLRAPDKSKTTLSQIAGMGNNVLYLSAVTVYELYIGASSPEKQNDIQLLVEGLIVLPFTDEVAIQAAAIYRNLKNHNQLIEFRDIFIAATCLVNNLPVKTLNKKHFSRIQDLVVL
jgi:predicted nucleic acid-binding protein